MEKDVRGEILRALLTPATVTELKSRTPNIKSFGSIAYHLQKLENQGVVTKEVDKTKRGHPTTYKLDKNMLKIVEEENNRKNQGMRIILKKIKDTPLISDDELVKFIKEEGLESVHEDDIFETSNNNYSTFHFKITPKGEKFLNEK